MSAIGTLDEVILYVEDMDAMVSFYTEVLGFDVAGGAPEHGFVRLDSGAASLALHAGRDGDVGEFAPKIVFAVEDLEAARSRLQDEGVDLSEVRSPAPGTEVCDGRDPEGNAFSIESRSEPE